MGYIIKWIIGIIIIYYILNKFILPIFRFTLFTGSKMQQMQDKMREMEQKLNQKPNVKSRVKKDGDYIDYEEVS